MTTHCMIPVLKSAQDYQAYRISPNDSNKLVIIFDPIIANSSVCIEIFDLGGKTPTHRHNLAVEMFFILKGEGLARCDGKSLNLRSGDSILVPPTGTHFIENTGSTRLYTLCLMVPNEDFTELIHSGIPVDLDEEDLQVLTRSQR